MKKLLVVLFSISFLAVSAACTNSQETGNGEEEKAITFLSNFPSDTLDPHLNWTPLRAGMVETLVKINEDLELEPWLATEWSTADHGKTWVFMINENAKFQNGEKVDAEAVKASFERNIEVSEAINNALKIESLKAEGQELVISLTESIPHFPSELIHPNTAVILADEGDIAKSPVGTGPFKAESFQAGSSLVLKKSDEYWDGEVNLDTVTMTFNDDANVRTLALQSGDADIVYRPSIESLETLKKDEDIITDVVPSPRTHLLMYNTEDEALKNVHIRKAIDALIDKSEIAKSVMTGQAIEANGPFLRDFPFSIDPAKHEHGTEIAAGYLEEAGVEVKDGQAYLNGSPLSFQVATTSFRPELPVIAQLLQSEAKELGIGINIKVVENIDEFLAENNDWNLATYSLVTAPRGDASYFLNSAYMDGGAFYYNSMEQDELKTIIQQLNSTVEVEERNEIAKSAGEIIQEEVLHSFIVHPNNYVSFKKGVENWQTSKSEYYMITKDLDVN
ncbi:ABC transporter substrate-binding protein [Bacillus lacus]|uniref:ABC transporter substrate-binding protein n=1 Tax=Metabacillus lacus TaxID=1983721 RepID=A0A7X2IZ09_9BACI|nr:nickel ABC transporter substrate-binding protein [Metabacillus lacus]MRX72408.1 ABC transporter substrate-binding protein [Metabacillus lacus]